MTAATPSRGVREQRTATRTAPAASRRACGVAAAAPSSTDSTRTEPCFAAVEGSALGGVVRLLGPIGAVVNGRRQRAVVTALERAIDALERGDDAAMEREAAAITELNQLEALAPVGELLRYLARAVALGANDDAQRHVDDLCRVLGPSPVTARLRAAWERRH